jgi:hypothetical protein
MVEVSQGNRMFGFLLLRRMDKTSFYLYEVSKLLPLTVLFN